MFTNDAHVYTLWHLLFTYNEALTWTKWQLLT